MKINPKYRPAKGGRVEEEYGEAGDLATGLHASRLHLQPAMEQLEMIASCIHDRIGFQKLSANCLHIVQKISLYPEKYLLVSVNKFASLAVASSATVSRCINFLGCSGYDEFQKEMKERLLEPQKLTSVYN